LKNKQTNIDNDQVKLQPRPISVKEGLVVKHLDWYYQKQELTPGGYFGGTSCLLDPVPVLYGLIIDPG
jgi:hypothetical protein